MFSKFGEKEVFRRLSKILSAEANALLMAAVKEDVSPSRALMLNTIADSYFDLSNRCSDEQVKIR